MKTLIIDDEKEARNVLSCFLEKYCPLADIVGEASSVNEAISLIRLLQPEVLLLDINMSDGSGFDLLDKVKDHKFHVIFTTAYDQFTLKAIKYSAVDYLLKPIDPEEIKIAIQKAAEVTNKHIWFRNETAELLINNMRDRSNATIALHDCKGINFIKVDDIISLNSNNSYTVFSIKGKEQLVSTKPIKDYEELLYTDGFYRIHNTCLVNLKHVSRYIKGEGGFVILSDNTQHEVSRRRKSEFLEVLSKSVKS